MIARAASELEARPLAGASFGAEVRIIGARDVIAAAEAAQGALPEALTAAGGLLLLRDFDAISDDPGLLVRLSRLFGDEVEDYRDTLTSANLIHPDEPRIFIVSNVEPVGRQPPPRPDPPLTADGRPPTRFPQRRGWHTDQSFRRPPPDISLFYCVQPAVAGQGQTLYADGAGAYAALSDEMKERVAGLEGLHVLPGTGRGEIAVRAGEAPDPLAPHEAPQRQPVARRHPVSCRRALYLCEAGQMDWVDGPFVGLEPGPDGAGARLLYELMSHLTQPAFTYAHAWRAGDLIVYDNRCLLHAATWFDVETNRRVMWRTTVSGNPGPEYAGEAKSWLPRVEPAEIAP